MESTITFTKMDTVLISSSRRIWLKVEPIAENIYRMYCINGKNEPVRMPESMIVYCDHANRVLDKGEDESIFINSFENHTIYYQDTHVLDFSHKTFWRV
jgi:hypothetical protein